MQIHEITAIHEGVLSTIGNDIKRAVTTPFQKAKYLMKQPGSLTNTGAYNSAIDNYYTDLVGQRQSEKTASTSTDLTAWAKNLASEWSKQPRPSSQAPVATVVAPTPVSQAPAAPAAAAVAPAVATPPVAPNPGGRVTPYMNVTTPATAPPKISKPPAAGLPTSAEYEKLQQRIAAADAKQSGQTNEAFSDLPGAKPTAGGAVAPTVTARPAGIKAPPPLQSRYAQNFKSWVTSKVADKSSGLGLADVEKMPELSRTLNQALAKVVTTQQTPTDNIAAVEQYLLMVGQAMQKLSAEQKSTQQQKNPKRQVSGITPLSSILNQNQIDALKKKGEDPAGATEIMQALELR